MFAINLQQLGLSLEEIAKYTMLTTEEVSQILKE
jgi:transcriptional regulator with XRE-family HTH domain